MQWCHLRESAIMTIRERKPCNGRRAGSLFVQTWDLRAFQGAFQPRDLDIDLLLGVSCIWMSICANESKNGVVFIHFVFCFVPFIQDSTSCHLLRILWCETNCRVRLPSGEKCSSFNQQWNNDKNHNTIRILFCPSLFLLLTLHFGRSITRKKRWSMLQQAFSIFQISLNICMRMHASE